MWYGFCIESQYAQTAIYHLKHHLMGSGPYQSDELSMLDSNEESVSLILLKIFVKIDCTIRVFWTISAKIMQVTSQ